MECIKNKKYVYLTKILTFCRKVDGLFLFPVLGRAASIKALECFGKMELVFKTHDFADLLDGEL